MTPLTLWTLFQEQPAVAPLRALAIPMLVLAGLVLMSAVLYDALTPKRRPNDPRDRPLPNLLVGSAALWALGAIAVWFFPFVREGRSIEISSPPVFGAPPAAAQQAGSGDSESGGETDVAAAAIQLMVTNGCNACHMLDGVTQMSGTVGPDLTRAARDAAERLAAGEYAGSATDVTEYLHESIVEPNVDITPGYQPIMPNTFSQSIGADDLDTIVNYLATLE